MAPKVAAARFTLIDAFDTRPSRRRGHMLNLATTEVTAPRRIGVAVTVAFTLLLIAAGCYFASLQSVWVDETTQLSGTRLPPGHLIAWLAGRFDPHFGVPPDRMPPISYLIDSACAHSLCGATLQFRLLHLAFAALGVATIVWLAVRNYGVKAAAVTGGFLVLSPKLIEQAVEIRAYPIFFLITCLQIGLVYRLASSSRMRGADLVVFGALSLASIYTHFFGLVSSMALLSGLLLPRLMVRRDAMMLIGTGLVVLLASTGIIPFVTAANSFSGVERPDADLDAYASFAVRLIGHSANWIATVPEVLFPTAVVILLVVGGIRASADFRRDGWEFSRTPLAALIIALVTGVAVTLVASLVASTFNSLKPQYSLWTFPIIALLLGAAFRRGGSRPLVKWVGALSAAALLIAAAWASTIFLANARWFVHGPADAIANEVDRKAEPVALLYRGEFGWGYFPTYFRFGDRVPQWFADEQGALHKVLPNGKVDPAISDARSAFAGKTIILADIQRETYSTMRLLYEGVEPSAIPIAAGPVPSIEGWHVTSSRIVPEFYWTRLTVYAPAKD